MAITRIELENFTVFERLVLEPSPGINVLIGTNGTGKTHLLKAAYAAATASRPPYALVRLLDIFRPFDGKPEHLVRRGADGGSVVVVRGRSEARIGLTRRDDPSDERGYRGFANRDATENVVYLPTKEFLSNAPGFRSLYAARDISFDLTYAELLDHAYLPALKNLPVASKRTRKAIRDAIGGGVEVRGETFFLRSGRQLTDFALAAEGHRRLALLWLLIGNGRLGPGSVVFWDEPEANLNPLLVRTVAEAAMAMQRLGAQFFLATHDFGLVRELDLAATGEDALRIHLLHREAVHAPVSVASGARIEDLPDDPLTLAQTSRYDRSIQRALRRSAAE